MRRKRFLLFWWIPQWNVYKLPLYCSGQQVNGVNGRHRPLAAAEDNKGKQEKGTRKPGRAASPSHNNTPGVCVCRKHTTWANVPWFISSLATAERYHGKYSLWAPIDWDHSSYECKLFPPAPLLCRPSWLCGSGMDWKRITRSRWRSRCFGYGVPVLRNVESRGKWSEAWVFELSAVKVKKLKFY